MWDTADIDTLRREVDLATLVGEELNCDMVEDEGRVVGNCPFHNDTHPSFAVFGYRVGCWSCGWRGDAFDVVREARGCDFKSAVEVVRALWAAGARRSLPHAEVPDDRDMADLRRAVNAARRTARTNTGPIAAFLAAKDLQVPVAWLVDRWRVGVIDNAIVAPHYTTSDQVTGYKVRTAAEPWKAASGSRLGALYGSWRPIGDDVILCEGETDTWWIDWLFGDQATVLGLPAGASTRRTEWASLIGGAYVTIAFDGDEAGRTAAAGWALALPSATVAMLPDGMDCASIKDREKIGTILGR